MVHTVVPRVQLFSIYFLNLQISDIMHDDTTTPLKGFVCRVTCAVILSGDIPFVEVRPHPWRSLKTSAIARVIPLSGMALWAAQRILQQAYKSSYAFPRYNRGSRTSANSASAAINKWQKNHVPEGCTMHSFRHSMRDRLRAVQCPEDIADQIGGWA